MRVLVPVFIASISISGLAYADNLPQETGPLASQNFTGTLWLTTDYVFRGISNTSSHPAAQGELDWTYKGFYVSAWASNTDFNPNTHLETDGYLGYRWDWAGLSFDVGGLYYGYPDSKTATDVDYWEGKIVVSKSFTGPLSPSMSFSYNGSPDFSGNDGAAHAVYGSLSLSFPHGINFGGGVGYQTVQGDKTTGRAAALANGFLLSNGTPIDGYDYVWWNAGLNTDFHGLHFDVSYYDTNESDSLKAFYSGGLKGNIDSRVVFTLSKSF